MQMTVVSEQKRPSECVIVRDVTTCVGRECRLKSPPYSPLYMFLFFFILLLFFYYLCPSTSLLFLAFPSLLVGILLFIFLFFYFFLEFFSSLITVAFSHLLRILSS